ncbi:trans-acting enoyl reductase family protein [Patulibacter sp.]|uniref:saccharopine dehydrogenase family protein n=1 Tax=Patulibacter sp. TaxID=1912859 RepID=UPI00271FEFF8|nr:saccharopine dehydrogenase NADP-binding domain-containing protein [Patulibacter sp.]MDO9407495.1 saccharopine dehydrogenase NADP-binding domain-containing protein [Patulibacter sp.]
MSTPAPGAPREHDVVVFGATGFVGRLTAAYLAEHAPSGTTIALAGRSRSRLEAVRASLPASAADWPLIEADSFDTGALNALARSAKVVLTTVGPYARYGLPLVAACAEAGTHYADLTGETLFMRRSIDASDAVARESGARIVHTCGFDSIPSDLGVHALHEAVAAADAGEMGETTLVVKGVGGGVSGGTIDSLRGQLDEGKDDKAVRRLAADPYALSPDRSADPEGRDERDPVGVSRDPDTGEFLAPFVMGLVNTRVVRRSNALQGYAYGRGLRYRELMRGGSGPLGAVKAASIVGGLAGLVGGMSFGPTRKVLDRVLPAPGDGPSEEQREKGFFRIDVTTTTTTGRRFRCRIAAKGDPGYKATAVMLGQAGLSLAHDQDRLPEAAGVLTPATAMGTVLTDRLRAAGHSYDVSEL